MNNIIYIIHKSEIISKGISCILQERYNCSVKNYHNAEELIKNEQKTIHKQAIILIEEIISSQETFQIFIRNNPTLSMLKIIASERDANDTGNYDSISIMNTESEFLRIVNDLFVFDRKESGSSEGLTKRETEVLKLVASGFSNKEIADKLFISTHTVISHRKNITEKLDIKSISGLTVYAMINNIVNPASLSGLDLI